MLLAIYIDPRPITQLESRLGLEHRIRNPDCTSVISVERVPREIRAPVLPQASMNGPTVGDFSDLVGASRFPAPQHRSHPCQRSSTNEKIKALQPQSRGNCA